MSPSVWSKLARLAKNAKTARVLLWFMFAQMLLFVPTAYTLIKTEPHVMYSRMRGGIDFNDFRFNDNISVGETADGYVSFINTENEITARNESGAAFTLTRGEVRYTDESAEFTIPAADIPAWVLTEQDFGELFNYLSLYNSYIQRVLAPMLLAVLAVFFVGQAVFYWAVAWLYGQTRRVTTYMTLWERVTVCVYASLPALPFGLAAGFIMPVFNVFIFEVIVVYVVYKALGHY